MGNRRLRSVLVVWAALVAGLILAAPVKRNAEFRWMRADVIRRALHHALSDPKLVHDYDNSLEADANTLLGDGDSSQELLSALAQWEMHDAAQFAETGKASAEEFSYGPDSLVQTITALGYKSPEFERSRLLCEARCVYDWIYLSCGIGLDRDWRKFRASALGAYPADAKVQWASGQLDLADLRYSEAAFELGRTLELAAALPGGVPAFCHATGISEQHLRGRLACALTMLGRWDEADQQSALALRAHDGFIAPLPWTVTLADEQSRAHFSATDDAEYRKAETTRLDDLQTQIRQRQIRRKQAEQYAQTLQPRLLEGWQAQLAVASARLRHPVELTEDQLEATQTQAAQANEALLRACLLAHQWQSALPYAAGPPTASGIENPYFGLDELDYDADLRHDAATLLTRLAAGHKLGATAQENLAHPTRQVASQPVEGADSTDSKEPQGASGELVGLLSADYLPYLLRTTEFAAALKQSGRQRDDVLAEIRAVTGYAPVDK